MENYITYKVEYCVFRNKNEIFLHKQELCQASLKGKDSSLQNHLYI